MATFKAEVQNRRADGTYNVRIRVTHNRQVKRISTSIYVTSADLTRGLKIKNQKVLDQANDLIRQFRETCSGIGFRLLHMSVDELVKALKSSGTDDRFDLDFIAFANGEIQKMKTGTAATYTAAFNALKRYIRRESISIFEINRAFLEGFEAFLEKEPSQRGSNRKISSEIKQKTGRAQSAYLACVRSVFNRAREAYNDEDTGTVRIHFYPFKKIKIQQELSTRKRALSIAEIQSIIDFPCKGGRSELARDCFLLSLGLIGMNSADIYSAEPEKKGIITYQRMKTKDRRADKAEMKLRMEPCMAPIIEKYRDLTGKKMFSFHHRYADANGFNKAINKGLKQIGQELGIEDLEYYAARHSWATIARSASVGIDKMTVHEALNHVDQKMKITDIYIDRDWTLIWEANRKVLSCFSW